MKLILSVQTLSTDGLQEDCPGAGALLTPTASVIPQVGTQSCSSETPPAGEKQPDTVLLVFYEQGNVSPAFRPTAESSELCGRRPSVHLPHARTLGACPRGGGGAVRGGDEGGAIRGLGSA